MFSKHFGWWSVICRSCVSDPAQMSSVFKVAFCLKRSRRIFMNYVPFTGIRLFFLFLSISFILGMAIIIIIVVFIIIIIIIIIAIVFLLHFLLLLLLLY